MKLHIIGCSGTGKSWLANTLSQKYNIPHLDLDSIFWDNRTDAYGKKSSPQERDVLLSEFLSKPSWIIEGVYYDWCGQCFEDADLILLLDIPKRIYVRRLVLRFFRRKLRIEEGKSGSFQKLLNLIKWTDKFQNTNLPNIHKMLEPHRNKVWRITSAAEVNQLLQQLPL